MDTRWCNVIICKICRNYLIILMCLVLCVLTSRVPRNSLSGVDCNVNSWPLSTEAKAYQQVTSMSIRYCSDYTIIPGCQFDLHFLENKK